MECQVIVALVANMRIGLIAGILGAGTSLSGCTGEKVDRRQCSRANPIAPQAALDAAISELHRRIESDLSRHGTRAKLDAPDICCKVDLVEHNIFERFIPASTYASHYKVTLQVIDLDKKFRNDLTIFVSSCGKISDVF